MNHSQPTSLKGNILIVDDTRESLRLLEELLKEQGYTVRPIPEGHLALMAVQANPPDLILLDIKMPGISGYEVCEQLKANPQTADIPIIFLSALDETIDKVKAFALGGVDYVTKPFHPEEVLARVKTHLILRNLQKHLEKLVGERTAELQHANNHLQQEITERKHAEYAVRASEQQYRALAENVADGIRIIQEGKSVFVNEALCSMLGYTKDELLQSDPFSIVYDEYKELFVQRFNKLLQGLSVPSIQAVCITKDGCKIWIEEQSSVITWEGTPAILTTIRDITERKLREIEMEKNRVHLKKENFVLRSTIKDRYKFGEIIGKSPIMQEIYELLTHASASDAHVTICGESGTGKELIARTIHQLSDRRKKAFIPVNCGAIPDTLFESEFFGHRKGAFTGADRDKEGVFDLAHHGTLFLDEVAELSPFLQVKLLRAIDRGEYLPLGSNTLKTVNVRIIAATNKNLEEQVEKGLMREDFFYRIQVISIKLPPLRDRKEDIPLLIDHFLERYNTDHPAIPGRIAELLYHYDWPGNIRQLQNILQRYLTVKRLDFLGPGSPKPIEVANISGSEVDQEGLGLQEALEAFEKQLITRILEQHRWHRGKTAATLHIPPRTLYRKMKKYQLL